MRQPLIAAAVAVLMTVGLPVTTQPQASAKPSAQAAAANPTSAHGSGIPFVEVGKVRIAAKGGSVSARIRWHIPTLSQAGRDHLHVQLVATQANGATSLLASKSDLAPGNDGAQTIKLKLSKSQSRVVRNAATVVLTASQQFDGPDADKLHEVTYVSPAPTRLTAGTDPSPSSDCSDVAIGPGANLANCDLTGARLDNADLTNADLSHADLTQADLHGTDLTGTKLDDAIWLNTTCPDGSLTTGSACGTSLAKSESGFSYVGPIKYWFHDQRRKKDYRYTTTPANLWYSFHPSTAVTSEASKTPLFVMLNGGPGAATSANLFANNTAPYTLTTDFQPDGSPGYAPNPNSWADLGHLLYIDPAQTGFSYNINKRAVDDPTQRFADYFLRGNFNPFIDADQVLRVVLNFLDSHKDLAGNPVVLVGESYGGTRVSTMLNLALFSDRYDTSGSSFFHDPSLVSLVESHFAGIGVPGPLTPEAVAGQFGRQILIQPQLTGANQDKATGQLYWDTNPSIIDDVAAAAGHPGGFTRSKWVCGLFLSHASCPIIKYVPDWDRDRYNWSKSATYSDDLELNATRQLTQLGKLNVILGTDVAKIDGIRAKDRRDTAYHILGVRPPKLQAAIDADPGSLMPGLDASQAYIDDQLNSDPLDDSLEANFGKLNGIDRYFVAWSEEVYSAYALNIFAPEYTDGLPLNADSSSTYGDFFLQNARYVATFLTDAAFDLVIYSPAIPPALRMHNNQVLDVTWQRGTQVAPLGQFDIHYVDGATVRLYNPFYAQSGHAVGATEPEKLRTDVRTWMACTDARSC